MVMVSLCPDTFMGMIVATVTWLTHYTIIIHINVYVGTAWKEKTEAGLRLPSPNPAVNLLSRKIGLFKIKQANCNQSSKSCISKQKHKYSGASNTLFAQMLSRQELCRICKYVMPNSNPDVSCYKNIMKVPRKDSTSFQGVRCLPPPPFPILAYILKDRQAAQRE